MKPRPEYVKEKTAELLKKAGAYSPEVELAAEWVAELHWKLEDIQEMILSIRKNDTEKCKCSI